MNRTLRLSNSSPIKRASVLCLALITSVGSLPAVDIPFTYRKELHLLASEKSGAAPDSLLFFFTEKGDSPQTAQRLQKLFSPGSALRTQLETHFRICIIELDRKETLKETKDHWKLVQEIGTPGTPALYLTDLQGRPFARHLGGIKKDTSDKEWVESLILSKENRTKRDALLEEAAKLTGKEQGEKLLQAFSFVPSESLPTAYPEEIKKLESALPESEETGRITRLAQIVTNDQKLKNLIQQWGNPALVTLKSARVNLALIDEYLKKESPEGDLLQFILLEYRFPLLMARAKKASEEQGKGVFSAESDRLFRQALEDLSTVISTNSTNSYGREAQRRKNEINQARRKLR